MICRNCGGEFDGSERFCPYCKGENREAARRQDKEAMEKLDRDYIEEKKRLQEQLPPKVIKKGTRYTVTALLAMLAAVVVITVIILSGKALGRLKADKQSDREVQKLEQYFAAEDYEAMSQYLGQIEKQGASLDKYWETAQAYRYYTQWICLMSEEWQEFIQDKRGRENPEDGSYRLTYMLEYAGTLFQNCDTWCSDLAFHGNEDVLQEFSEKTEYLLRETYRLTDEDIEVLKREEPGEQEIEKIVSEIVNQQRK